jgi:hypothetical protein
MPSLRAGPSFLQGKEKNPEGEEYETLLGVNN